MVRTAAASRSIELERAIARTLESAPVPFVSAYLFGSQAEGRSHRESDIDIGILLPYAADQSRRDRFEAGVALTSHLIAGLHRNEIDVVVLNDAPPHFARRIVTRGHRVACTDQASDHAFVRDVQLRAADLEPFLRRTRQTKLAALSR
jgi:predicted nucleotidyltransferase